MKANRVIYETGKVAFGMSHLVLQTMADACIVAEVAMVKRTGYYNGKDMVKLHNKDVEEYKQDRRDKTSDIQKGVTKISDEAYNKAVNYFNSKRLKHGTV